MHVKAIIAKTKFGLLFIDTDNNEFDDDFIDDVHVDLTLNKNSTLERLEQEPKGLYSCLLDWDDDDCENVFLVSYKDKPLTWQI